MLNEDVKIAFEKMDEIELDELLSGLSAEKLDEDAKKRIVEKACIKAEAVLQHTKD